MARAATKKKAQGASRNSKPAARKGGGAPGWLWLLLGLTVGLFAAFLWHLWELRQDSRHKPAAASQAVVQPHETGKESAANATPAAAEEPRFDFYTLLPNQQVMPKKTEPGKTAQAPAATPEPGSAKPAGTDQTPYVLQAGSFRSQGEADKRRAAVLLLGLPVKVQKVPVKADNIWYRVVVGPFRGRDAAQAARASLRNNGVDSMVLKQG